MHTGAASQTHSNGLKLRKATATDYVEVINVLTRCGLTGEGLNGADDFVVLARGEDVIGCAALERYEDYGLLRSVAVLENERRQGFGTRLIEKILQHAREDGVSEVILFARSARSFFEEAGFRDIEREQVPLAVQTSVDFQTAGPKTQAMSMTL
jgi:amino-acid N-acetyltransferase